jgi:hypothetical protein
MTCLRIDANLRSIDLVQVPDLRVTPQTVASLLKLPNGDHLLEPMSCVPTPGYVAPSFSLPRLEGKHRRYFNYALLVGAVEADGSVQAPATSVDALLEALCFHDPAPWTPLRLHAVSQHAWADTGREFTRALEQTAGREFTFYWERVLGTAFALAAAAERVALTPAQREDKERLVREALAIQGFNASERSAAMHGLDDLQVLQ